MAQQNEHVFFNDGEYLVTDLRFVTQQGVTHPMSTIQNVYRTWDEEAPAWYNNVPINLGLLVVFVASAASCGYGWVLSFQSPWWDWWVLTGLFGYDPLSVLRGPILIMIGIALLALLIVITRKLGKRQRHRRRYWVHFLFAGEGTFTTAIEQDARTQFLSIGNPARAPVQTTTRRNPDYSVWSYNEEWAARFFDAVNEARIAREAR